MKSLIIFLLTSLVYAAALGQERFTPGFYINNSGDTVKGYLLNKRNYATEIQFRTTISSTSQSLSIDDVKSFGLSSGEMYFSMKFPDQSNLPATATFVRMIVGGGMELLSYRGQYIIGTADKGRFRMAKGKNSNATTALKDYQTNTGIFNILFQDCPSVKADAQHVPIVEEKLSQLIKSYNDCRSLPHREFHVEKLKRVSYIGFFAGLTGSNISFASTDYVGNSPFLFRTKFPVSFQPTFGIIGLRSGRGTSSILGFQGELAFAKINFTGKSAYKNDVGGYTIKELAVTNLNYSFLTFRAGLRLTGRSHKINPYLSFGLGHQMSISPKSTVTIIREINSSVEEEHVEFDMSQSGLVVWGAVGFKKNVLGKHAIFLDGNCEQGFIAAGGKVTSIGVRLGFLL